MKKNNLIKFVILFDIIHLVVTSNFKIQNLPRYDYGLDKQTKDKIVSHVLNHFPGALREEHFIEQLYDVLHSYSEIFGDNTLLATSFCCDEINRNFEYKLSNIFGGRSFSMGGLAGFPFGGITSFCAFSHHIPEQDGSALLVYGPHVGVDINGVVGKINRRKIPNSGFCCGSAVSALNLIDNCENVYLDYQQQYVKEIIKTKHYREQIFSAKNPQAELPRVLFDKQTEMINYIIDVGSKNNIPQNVILAVVGGIHINTPSGVSDYFLPLIFELRNSNGTVIKNFLKYSSSI